jgi:hypothetical protein
MRADGSAIEPITHTPIFDNEPKVLADGRVAFVRSGNFFSRAKVETQIHAIMPDGTAGQTEFGADIGADYGKRLRMLGYGSPAPLPDGRIGVISNQGNFLGRTLGNLRDPAAVDTLLASLAPELNEARHGRPDPAAPNVHLLQLDPTPCWRGAAAWALGRIGDRRAAATLLSVVAHMDNAVDTRYAAAKALSGAAGPEHVAAMAKLAADYPEVSTRKALLESMADCEKPGVMPSGEQSWQGHVNGK